mgnify:CR=1 FL=1
MAEVILMPRLSDTMTEGVVAEWHKKVGDTIQLDETLLDIATDKVDNELPSEAQGTLVQRFFEVDQVAQVGDGDGVARIQLERAHQAALGGLELAGARFQGRHVAEIAGKLAG